MSFKKVNNDSRFDAKTFINDGITNLLRVFDAEIQTHFIQTAMASKSVFGE